MNVVFLAALSMVFLVAALFCGAFYFMEVQSKLLAAATILLLALGISGFAWIGYASLLPAEELRTFRVTPSKMVNQDGTYLQMFSYIDQNGNQVIENANNIFHGVIPEKSVIVIREYKKFYYAGLIFADTLSPDFRVEVVR